MANTFNAVEQAVLVHTKKWHDEMTELCEEGLYQAILPISKTGNLFYSVRKKRMSRYESMVYIDTTQAPYASYVLKGTGKHVIRPVRVKKLKFTDKHGKTVFAKVVNHPGAKGYDYVTKAVEYARANFK